jgi:hypothetical protein
MKTQLSQNDDGTRLNPASRPRVGGYLCTAMLTPRPDFVQDGTRKLYPTALEDFESVLEQPEWHLNIQTSKRSTTTNSQAMNKG